jgi:hypothetical protein
MFLHPSNGSILKELSRIGDELHLRPGDAIVSTTLPFTRSLLHPLTLLTKAEIPLLWNPTMTVVPLTSHGSFSSHQLPSSYAPQTTKLPPISNQIPHFQAFNIPLNTFVHTRALMVAITYVSGQLSPPGTQTSLWGLVSFPVRYFAYALVAIDFVIGGKQAALSALTGIIVGHLWWWGVWESRALRELGTAPGWMKALIETPPPPGTTPGSSGGSSSRSRRPGAQTTGYSWGSGHRLGDS